MIEFSKKKTFFFEYYKLSTFITQNEEKSLILRIWDQVQSEIRLR